jgi:hypothetical protein
VGTAVNIEHCAASAMGAHIRAEAVLESFDGRFYLLRRRPENWPWNGRSRGGQHWEILEENPDEKNEP